MAFVNVVVALDNEVVVPVVIGESHVQLVRATCVSRIEGCYCGAQRVHAAGTGDRCTGGLHTRDCIGDTHGRIPSGGDCGRAVQRLRIRHERTNPFVRAKNKSLVLDNRSANAPAKLMLAQGTHWIRCGVKVIARVEGVVAFKRVGRSVNIIRAGLDA